MNIWGRKHSTEEQADVVPILCKFWHDEDVWNASAEHLAVAAFGKTFEEAQDNLQGALIAHIECWVEEGKGEELFARLREHARDDLSVNRLPARQPMTTLLIGMRDNEVFAAA
ncbi:MAG: type II toxin-antitoxin system HicB family antitoxin [Candidatus Acidiferrales bacterium]